MNTFQLLIVTLSTGALLSCNAQKPSTMVLKDKETATINNSNPVSKTNDNTTKVMVFEEGLYSYQLVITGDDIEIIYTYGSHEPITETGKFTDNKIIVNGCDDCYQLNDDSFCVYNPETDGKDCYSINADKSYTVEEE
jgi:hypothetical protein